MRRIAVTALILVVCAISGLDQDEAKAGTLRSADHLRVSFERGSSRLPQQGSEAIANEGALRRIANVLHRMEDLKGVRLVFVTARPVCASSENCDSAALARERLLALARIIETLVPGSHAAAQKLSFAFSDDPNVKVTPPAAPKDYDSMAAFTEVIDASRAPDACGSKVLLRDPDLPPMIQADNDFIPVLQGDHARLGPRAEVAIVPEGKSFPPVWGDDRGRFLKDSRLSNFFAPLPEGATRLYLFKANRQDDELSSFLASLGETFVSIPSPSFLPIDGTTGTSTAMLPLDEDRGVGDNARPVRPQTIRPRPQRPSRGALESTVTVCAYRFSIVERLDRDLP